MAHKLVIFRGMGESASAVITHTSPCTYKHWRPLRRIYCRSTFINDFKASKLSDNGFSELQKLLSKKSDVVKVLKNVGGKIEVDVHDKLRPLPPPLLLLNGFLLL